MTKARTRSPFENIPDDVIIEPMLALGYSPEIEEGLCAGIAIYWSLEAICGQEAHHLQRLFLLRGHPNLLEDTRQAELKQIHNEELSLSDLQLIAIKKYFENIVLIHNKNYAISDGASEKNNVIRAIETVTSNTLFDKTEIAKRQGLMLVQFLQYAGTNTQCENYLNYLLEQIKNLQMAASRDEILPGANRFKEL